MVADTDAACGRAARGGRASLQNEHGDPGSDGHPRAHTASIYADAASSHLCLEGGSLSITSSSGGASQADVPAGQILLGGSGMKNSSGQALTLVDGRIGAGVTSVMIDRSDGSSIQATVSGGWYLAWWPGTVQATAADVTRSSGTVTEHFPSTPQGPASPGCPVGSGCSSGYSFGSAHAGSTQNTLGTSRSR